MIDFRTILKEQRPTISLHSLERLAMKANISHGPIKELSAGVFRLGCGHGDWIAIDSRVLDVARLELLGDYRDDNLNALMWETPTRMIDLIKIGSEPHPEARLMRRLGTGPTIPILFAQGMARALPLLSLGIEFSRYSRKQALRDLEGYAHSRHAMMKIVRSLSKLPPLSPLDTPLSPNEPQAAPSIAA